LKLFKTRQQLKEAVGAELGVSDWLPITQDRVNMFADATGDHQWIHVDLDRAASGPFGVTIGHGYLTVSLLPVLNQQIFRVDAKMAVNYGLNKLRFPAPVPVGSSVRARSTLKEAIDVGDAVQIVVDSIVEVDNSDKPAAVAESVSRYYL
jgi:acyl dehydratase